MPRMFAFESHTRPASVTSRRTASFNSLSAPTSPLTQRKQTALSSTGASSSSDGSRSIRSASSLAWARFSAIEARKAASVVLEGEPQLERAEPAGELDRLVEEREALDGVVARRLHVFGAVGEREPSDLGVAVEEDAAVERLVEPFVRVERDRVGLRHARELLRLRKCGRSAVGAVDVEPQTVPPRDVCELGERIDRAAHDRPGRTDHGNALTSCVSIVRDRSLQRRHFDPHLIVDLDQAQICAPEPEEPTAFGIDMCTSSEA